MSSELMTDARRAFVEAIRDWCTRECGTREQRMTLTEDGHVTHNPKVYEQLAERGWVGASLPEEYGGQGGGMVDCCLFLEETARGGAPISGHGVTMIVAGAYERFGTEEQKHEILGGITRGRSEAIAMSEPEAGSDVGALKSRAVRDNGDFVINGQKTW